MKTFMKRMAMILLTMAGLLVVFHLVENWRGARALAQWEASTARTRGPKSLEDLAPPFIPDDQNFARHPGISGISGSISGNELPSEINMSIASSEALGYSLRAWAAGKAADLEAMNVGMEGQDLGRWLATYSDQLHALEEASLRPHCRVQSTYDIEKTPSYSGMRTRVRILSLRAVVALRENQSEAALKDVLTILRTAKHLQGEPNLFSQLLAIACVNTAIQPIWEGHRGHQWGDAQLARLEDALGQIDLIASYKRMGLAEAIISLEQLKKLAEMPRRNIPHYFSNFSNFRGARVADFLALVFLPKGWIYQNMIQLAQNQQANAMAFLNVERHLVDPKFSEQVRDSWAVSPQTPYTMLANLYNRDVTHLSKGMAYAQSLIDQARVSCALERYRLAKKAYPNSLDEITSTYLNRLPMDLIGGNPLHYKMTSNGTYHLYSVGWKATDGGGRVEFGFDKTMGRSFRVLEKSDWVWMSPTAFPQ